MLIINNIQSEKYLSQLNITGNISINEFDSDKFTYSKTVSPFKDNTINKICKIISESASGSNWQLLYISDYNIFPSTENLNLYYTFQKFHGGNGEISDYPGHLFFSHENNELASMIAIALLNCFDAIVVSQNDYSRFKISHHGIIKVLSQDPELIKILD